MLGIFPLNEEVVFVFSQNIAFFLKKLKPSLHFILGKKKKKKNLQNLEHIKVWLKKKKKRNLDMLIRQGF